MNKAFCTTIALSILLSVAQAGIPLPSDPPPPSPPKSPMEPNAADPNWNWLDASTYQTFYGSTILAPWSRSEHFGVNVSEKLPIENDGWRLYVKRLTCADYHLTNCTSADIRYKYPYFALYNIHTGILRTLIFINDANYAGAKMLYAKMGYVSNSTNNLGLLLNNGDVITTMDKKASTSDSSVLRIVPSYTNKWLILDYPLSFDPGTPITSNSYFTFDFDAYLESAIVIDGKFNFTLSNDLRAGAGGAQHSLINSLQRAVSAGKTAFDTVGQQRSSVSALANTMIEQGATLMSRPNQTVVDVGRNILDAGMALNGKPGVLIGDVLGYWKGYNVFSTLMNVGGNQQIVTYSGSGTMQLSGTITSTFPTEFVRLGMHQSESSVEVDNAMLDYHYNGRLGLYSIDKPIAFETGADYFKFVGPGIRDVININPHSDMVLVDVKYAPQIIVTNNFGFKRTSLNLASPIYDEHKTHEYYWVVPSRVTQITSYGDQSPTEKAPNKLLDEWNTTFYWRPESSPLSSAMLYPTKNVFYSRPLHFIDDAPSILDMKSVKVYLRFEHKSRSDIYVEEIREIPVSLSKKTCGVYFYGNFPVTQKVVTYLPGRPANTNYRQITYTIPKC